MWTGGRRRRISLMRSGCQRAISRAARGARGESRVALVPSRRCDAPFDVGRSLYLHDHEEVRMAAGLIDRSGCRQVIRPAWACQPDLLMRLWRVRCCPR